MLAKWVYFELFQGQGWLGLFELVVPLPKCFYEFVHRACGNDYVTGERLILLGDCSGFIVVGR